MTDLPANLKVAEVDAADLQALLAAKAQLPPHLAVVLHKVVHGYVALVKVLGHHRVTIAELRRLLGVSGPRRNNEKTKAMLAGHDLDEKDDPEVSLPTGAGPDPAAARVPVPPTVSGTAAEIAPTAGQTVNVSTVEEKKWKLPKGHGRLSWKEYPDAACIPVLHETLRPGDTCPLCGKGKLYDTQRPSPILRIIGQAPLIAKCWLCEVLRCNTCGHLFTAAAPDPAKGPKYDPTAVGMIILERYGTGLPHYRQARLQQDLHTPVPAATQWDVVRQAAKELQPVFAELRRQAAQAKLLYADDSYVRILAFTGKRLARLLDERALPNPDRTGLFTTAITAVSKATEEEERLITIFISGRKHAGENLDDLLQLRDKTLGPPLLMTDALNRNVPKNHEVIESNCLAHGRRHVIDAIKKCPAECAYLLQRIGRLYRIDGLCAHFKLTADQRLTVHHRWSKPITDELHKWMTAQFEQRRIEPNSGMGKALNYLLRRWEKFTVFLRRAGAPLDNNISERALKMAIQVRNNSLFYRNEDGASVGDLCMSLIHTARLHGVNPFEYLTALLVNATRVAQQPADWLPWNYQLALARRNPDSPEPEPNPPRPSSPPPRPRRSEAPRSSRRPERPPRPPSSLRDLHPPRTPPAQPTPSSSPPQVAQRSASTPTGPPLP